MDKKMAGPKAKAVKRRRVSMKTLKDQGEERLTLSQQPLPSRLRRVSRSVYGEAPTPSRVLDKVGRRTKSQGEVAGTKKEKKQPRQVKAAQPLTEAQEKEMSVPPPEACGVCGGPLHPEHQAMCPFCGTVFQLGWSTTVEMQDCGKFYLDDESLALVFACQRCVEQRGL